MNILNKIRKWIYHRKLVYRFDPSHFCEHTAQLLHEFNRARPILAQAFQCEESEIRIVRYKSMSHVTIRYRSHVIYTVIKH